LGFSRLALVVPVYLGAPYVFFNKVFLLKKEKKYYEKNDLIVTTGPLLFNYYCFKLIV